MGPIEGTHGDGPMISRGLFSVRVRTARKPRLLAGADFKTRWKEKRLPFPGAAKCTCAKNCWLMPNACFVPGQTIRRTNEFGGYQPKWRFTVTAAIALYRWRISDFLLSAKEASGPGDR